MAQSAFVRYSSAMRIVIATPFYPPEKGVLGMYAKGLEGAFLRLGHEVTVVRFSAFSFLPPVARHIAFGWGLYSAAKGSDLIFALDTWSVGMPAMLVSKMTGVPLSLRIGGDFLWEAYVERTKKPIRFSDVYSEGHFNLKERLIMRGTRAILNHARALFFNTRFHIEQWQPVYGFAREKAHVLENVYAKRAPVEKPRGHVFVSAGRPIALKNYGIVEKAIARLKKTHPDIELDRRMLPPDEHYARVRGSYAVIIPSFSEISSNMAIDAVIAGKPFIMTSDTGTKERLGEYGIFIDTRSEDEMVRAMERLLDEKEYTSLIERIKVFNFEHSFDDMAKEILSVI